MVTGLASRIEKGRSYLKEHPEYKERHRKYAQDWRIRNREVLKKKVQERKAIARRVRARLDEQSCEMADILFGGVNGGRK